MPNEVTSLLNALNSYITCPVCKVTNDIEIILTCGHLICKNCKTKRTKCSICYSELSGTKPNPPSINFVNELCKELLKASTGEDSNVESEPNVGNSIVTPSVKEEQPLRIYSGTVENKKLKKKINLGFKEDVEISNVVKVINEINKFRKKDSYRKHSDHKKRLVFYKNYCKHKEERKVYRKILKGFGIVGIDKQIKKIKAKHALSGRKKELNGQLNTIISRLNDQYPNCDNLDNTRFNYSLKMISDSDSLDSDQNVKMNHEISMNFSDAKNGFGSLKCDLMRNGHNVIKTNGSLKRKKVDSGTDEGPHSKAFVKNIDIVDDYIESDTANLVSLDKKLGGIVDETEIIQRYINPSIKETKDKNVNNKYERLSKSEVKNIVSEYMEEITPSSEESGLQSDIMVDMLHNVSNEIIVVGNNLCTAEKDNEISNSSTNGSCDVSSLKNHSLNNSSPYKQRDIEKLTVIIKNETENHDNDVIVVSDSEDNVKVEENCPLSNCIQKKTDHIDIHLEKDINIMRCRIILNDLVPSVFQSPVNDKPMDNSECLGTSDVKKSSTVSCNAKKTKSLKKKKMNSNGQKRISGNNSVNTIPKKRKKDRCDEVLNNFEGFTEDDILILTVKLALFKMNGCKYSKNLSSSSLYTLDGKQILIKDVSQEQSYSDSLCCQNKIPDLTIEISDSEDESGKTVATSSAQTENDLLMVSPISSISKMRPASLDKLRRFEVENEHFTENDVLPVRKTLTSKTPLRKKSIASVSQNSSVLRATPVASGVLTENDLLTPTPSTSKIRPVSLVKLRGFESENEKFMQNDVLDIRKPLTPDTPLGKESVVSSLSQNSSVLRTTPVSRRQLSFLSPPVENKFQYQDDGASTSDVKATGSVPSSLNDDWQVLHYRMQHMMPSNPEDALHSEFEHSGICATRLTFTTCGLNSKETAQVTKLAQMTKSCLSKDFTHNTTHLVIGATGRGKLEYYLAIAYRAFIVTMDWVSLCLALNKILPVTGFIPTEDEGPLKCLEPNALPFVGFHVFSKILPTSSSYPISEITKTLLSLGGARVLPSLDAFHTLQDGNYPRFFVYNSKSVLTQPILDKCASLHILPIQFMWVYESIGAFRAIPVMDFLDIGIHSRTLIRDYKVPDQLACSRYPRLEGEFHPQILDERYQRSL